MLFLDTSAVLFLYVNSSRVGQTDESDRVGNALQSDKAVALSVLTVAELAAGLTRLRQDAKITSAEAQEAYKLFLEDWAFANRVEVSVQLALEASALARSRGLRGADAVQLASAAALSREVKGVQLLTFDGQLNQAAKGLVRLWGE